MNELEKHFPTQLNLLKNVVDKFKKSQNEIRELNEIVSQLKNTNIILRQSEAKLNEKFQKYNDQIYTDTKIINDYYKMKNENQILKTEKESLKNLVFNLERKIKQIEVDNKRNIENIKNNFRTKEKVLEEQIECLQASNTLDSYEKENEIKKIKYDYEQKLENVVKREQSLKIELFDLKHHMTSSVSVLNKKISELQEKNKRLESNKPSSSNVHFMSAKNILNISTANLPSNFTSTSNSSDIPKKLMDKTSTNQVNNNTQIQNTVNINNIEINRVKKFQFRKPHGSAKKLLSEDFDPFKMHKENSSSYSFQKDSSLHLDTDTSCNIIDNSLVETEVDILQNQQKFDDFDEDENYVIEPEPSTKQENKCSSFVSRKRKLFNPNNFDYLE